jgi:hypothetical protein
MKPFWPVAALLIAAALAYLRIRRPAASDREPPSRPNYAGIELPVVLGRVLVLSAQVAILIALGLALLAGPVPKWPVSLILVAGCLLLYPAGAMDDRREHGPRGLRGHVESLLHGRPTTGIMKLVVGVLAAAALSMELGGGLARASIATLLVALSVNVTNALDVRPGRALKWALLILIPASVAAWGEGIGLALLAYIGAGAVVLWFDLSERGMLGDAGSNPLGLVVGAGLAAVLPLPGLLIAVAILIGLQVAAETVTISRLIEAVPPLRWLDGLGRRN